MIEIMKADLQRIFRGKGVYITFSLFVGFVLLTIFEAGHIGIRIETDTLSSHSDLDVTGFLLTGKEMVFYLMRNADNILYFILPFIIFIAGADFSSGTAKNMLTSGTSRVTFYLAKLLLAIGCSTFIYCSYLVIPTVFVTNKNGFGGSLNGEFFLSLIRPFLLQWLLILAVTSVGIFLVFTTKKVATVNSGYLAFLLAPSLIIMILIGYNEKFINFIHYDLVYNMRTLGYFSELLSKDITTSLLMGMGYILVSTVGGLLIFRESEVK